ncbi:MAG: hypothetical protein M3077_11495 [Candidatus Dormibacteraeota bacterium]|nr:hypothetical protein [Candidatus Dormibacteraeota bacterium]
MRRVRARPTLVVLAAAALVLLLAVIASTSLRKVTQAVIPAAPCSPHPCAAPEGFEADFTAIRAVDGVLRMAVTFHNHTTGGFEAVSSRHTSPADFQLRDAAGHQTDPIFSSLCPHWAELRVERGKSAGPEPLCFAAPAGDVRSAQVIWSPDLGLLFDDVQIPLK